MSDTSFSISVLSVEAARRRVLDLAEILLDCVAGGASVSFMAGFGRTDAAGFWERVVDGVARGERLLLLAEAEDGSALGTVQLVLDHPPNQPHRADVSKLLVHRSARRRGVAEALMRRIEVEASVRAKTLLVLDTTHGGAAERLYDRLGWVRLGIMPNHAMMPDGAWSDTTFFYRHLARPAVWISGAVDEGAARPTRA